MTCNNCGTVNPKEHRFCGSCGLELKPDWKAVAVPGEDGAYYCFKHKKEITRVTCGRCEKPICHRCSIIGPVGPRCRECARHKVGVRPRGLAHDLTRGVAGSPVANRAWYAVFFALIFSFFSNLFGGRRG